MADAVVSKTLVNNSKYHIVCCQNTSDGTGESAVAKVDISGLTGAPTKVTIEEIWFDCVGMAVRILFDHTTDDQMLTLAGTGHWDFSSFGGINDPASAGGTGDILFTTVGHTSGDTYNIILKVRLL